jgi:predicted nuclease of predicted toxin-antitoxin system
MTRPRFHLDEQVNPAIATALRRYGINVTTTVEAGLRTTADYDQWAFAQREQRVIVTHDADFPRIARLNPSHSGIVFSRKDARTIRQMVDGLILIYEVLSTEEMRDHVEYL